MTHTVAIFRRTTGDYCRSELDMDPQVMAAVLRSFGVRPLNQQQRLLPAKCIEACKSQYGCAKDKVCPVMYTPCTVFEIAESEFNRCYKAILSAGFDIWSEEDDIATELYDEEAEDYDIPKPCRDRQAREERHEIGFLEEICGKLGHPKLREKDAARDKA
jgi:hypothetical protein